MDANANNVVHVLQKFSHLLQNRIREQGNHSISKREHGVLQQLAAAAEQALTHSSSEAVEGVTFSRPHSESQDGDHQAALAPPAGRYSTNMHEASKQSVQRRGKRLHEDSGARRGGEPAASNAAPDAAARGTEARSRRKRAAEREVVYLRNADVFPKLRRRQGGGACGGCFM